MNLLILGGTGYIGRALVSAFAKEPEHTVWSASRSSAPQPPRVQEVTLDLGNQYTLESLPGWLEDHQIDTVIHAAGPPGDVQCRRDTWRAYACHVTVPQILTMDWPKGRLIYLSTLLDPTGSPYAQLKRMGETYVRRNPRNVILRLGSVYGAGPNDGVVSKFIRASLQGEVVTVIGDGSQTIPLVHIHDVAELVQSAVRGGLTNQDPRRSPIVQIHDSSRVISITDLLARIARLANVKPTQRRYQAGMIHPYTVDSALPIVLPHTTIDDGLQRAIFSALAETGAAR